MSDDSPRSGFPWRGLLLGTILIPPTTLFGTYAYIVAQATLWTQTSLLRGPVFTLFFLVLINLAVARFAKPLRLTERDLLLAYAMQCVATALGGIGWSQFLVPSLGSPLYYATPENHFADFQSLIPGAWWIRDADAVENLYRGHSTLYQRTNWAPAVAPTICWTVFMVLLAGVSLCLAQLLREQWISRERLTFPLTYLPLEMSRSGGSPAFWTNRLLWLGFGLAAFIDCVNAIHFLVPAVPELPVKPTGPLLIGDSWTTRPLSAMRPFYLSFYPFMIGIGFLLTLDVAFGCWAWYLLIKVAGMAAVMAAVTDSPQAVGRPLYIPELGVGAFLAMAGLALWRSRHDLARASWRGPPVDRGAVVGLTACVLLLLWFVGTVGLPSWLAGAWLAIYAAYAIGCARIVSETGSGWTFSPRLNPHDMLLRARGAPVLGPKQATLFAWLVPFDMDFRDAVMPQVMHGLRLLPDDGGRGRPLVIALLLATLVGVVAGIWAHLHVYYQYGIDTASTRRWPAQVGRAPFDLLANQLKGSVPAPYELGAVAFGAGLFGALVATRARLLWWPLHPVGFALSTTQSMDYLWLPFLIAWAIKAAVLRYGGMKLYRRLMPFFLGMILGDYVVPLLWAVYGTLTGQQMYLSFPH